MTILKRLRLVNWRSIGEVELDFASGLPTLLYGENEAGKSNILAGVEAFCALALAVEARALQFVGDEVALFPWVERRRMDDDESIVELKHAVRYGESRASLLGEFEDSEGQRSSLRFELSADLYESSRDPERGEAAQLRTARVSVDSERPLPGKLPKVLRIGEGRGFQREYLPQNGSGSSRELGSVSARGAGVKQTLFRFANHPKVEFRKRYQWFQSLVRQSPFAIEQDPIVAVDESLEIQLLVDNQPIEERGMGAQQWILALAMIALEKPDVLLFEEPETNLSWEAQRRLASFLRDQAEAMQIVVASHSPHLGNAVGENGAWYRVIRGPVNRLTQVEKLYGEKAVWERFDETREGNPVAPDSRKLTLFPGNLLRLHDEAVRHLKIKVGDVVVTSLEDQDLVCMESLEHWLGSDESEVQ